MTIRRLPDHLVNQIAAGEVVERPASALKEIVENALDAAATHIEIDLEMGGKSLIRVRDNGNGIKKDELALALTRHATSKLPDETLDKIHTLGFRGEALPSIASVSRLTLTSRAKGSSESWQINSQDNKIFPASLYEGTVVEIKDLFHRVPARLKFLKTDAAEFSACKDVILRLALAYPHVSFTLRYGQTKLNFPGQNLKDRIAQILGLVIEGNFISLNSLQQGISLKGLLGLPTFNRADSNQQFFFVNGRPVRDRLFYASVKVGYSDLIPKDRHGICVLFLDLPSSQLDINVHPAKTEVRFAKPADVRNLIISTMKNHLAQESGKISAQAVSSSSLSSFTRPYIFSDSHGVQKAGFRETSFDIAPSSNIDIPQFDDQNNYPLGAPRAQIHENYIISQTQDGIIIIDQHAAHERLTYEKLKAEMENGITRQGLLVPEIVTIDDLARESILAVKDKLVILGLELDAFGPETIIIRSIPALLVGKFDAYDFIETLISQLENKSASDALEEKLLNALATTACHWSIRSGRRLNTSEMESLLRQMEKTPHSGQCNHGRPTYIKLSLQDLESLFERR